MLRRVVKVASVTSLSACGVGIAALAIDAPDADHDNGDFDPHRRHDACPEWLHNIGRLPLLGFATAVAKLYMTRLNPTAAENVEILERAISERPTGTALITVSNHKATVDDPAVLANLLPWKYALPSVARWSLVSQEYSYTKGRIARTFFFGAKSLPVKRGGGIDQSMLQSLFEKVQEGTWVHIFPEGKIDQHQILGGRTGPRAAEIGRLKWGTAKLIARADVRPIVVPFYHVNMQKVMPQDENNRLISIVPKTGVQVAVKVGEPINFDDLFEKYAEDRVVGSQAPWATQEREKALYSAITLRIEHALLALAKDMSDQS